MHFVVLTHRMTTSIAYLLYIATFVFRCRETVIHPKERAYLHLIIRLAQLLYTVCIYTYNLARAEELFGLKTEVEVGR